MVTSLNWVASWSFIDHFMMRHQEHRDWLFICHKSREIWGAHNSPNLHLDDQPQQWKYNSSGQCYDLFTSSYLQACESRSFLQCLVATNEVKFNPLTPVLSFKCSVLKLTSMSRLYSTTLVNTSDLEKNLCSQACKICSWNRAGKATKTHSYRQEQHLNEISALQLSDPYLIYDELVHTRFFLLCAGRWSLWHGTLASCDGTSLGLSLKSQAKLSAFSK